MEQTIVLLRTVRPLVAFALFMVLPGLGAANRSITLDVVVTGKDGKPVPGLQESDFTVLDNKKPQNLDLFQPVENGQAGPDAKVSVETILLIDRINPSFEVANDERNRLVKFFRQDDGKLAHPLSLVFFSDAGVKIQPASADGNALATALEQSDSTMHVSRRSQGILGAVEQAQLSLRALASIATFEEKKPGRKMLIWLSPGWPPISGPQSLPGPEEHKRFFDSIIETSNALLRAHISLYSIDPIGMEDASQFKTGYYDPYIRPVTTASKAQADNLALQVLVNHTGGRSLSASNDIGAQIADCIGDQSAYYIMSITAAQPSEGPNEYHGLEIRIGKPGLKARALTGYYARP